MWFVRDKMPDLFNEKTEPKTNQPSNINIQPKVAQPNKAPIIIVEGEASGSVAQMVQEENELLDEKQRLLEIMDELENKLTSEIICARKEIYRHHAWNRFLNYTTEAKNSPKPAPQNTQHPIDPARLQPALSFGYLAARAVS